ncbi:hypothetical protein E4U21_001384 [Claviceps maximensis]|nr:hypothetical protein E4U21_001384 [Claviceps maximensis]
MPPSKKWEMTAELDLCMAIIITGGSTAASKWLDIHTVMRQLGYDFTKDALSQHYTKKILRAFRPRLDAGKLDMSPGSSKRKAVKDEDGLPATESPVKKQKQTRKKKADADAEMTE